MRNSIAIRLALIWIGLSLSLAACSRVTQTIESELTGTITPAGTNVAQIVTEVAVTEVTLEPTVAATDDLATATLMATVTGVPTNTLLPTSTVAPTSTVPPTFTATSCPYTGKFSSIYSNHSADLGCFRQSVASDEQAAVQEFIGGWMFWDNATKRIYVYGANRVALIYDTSTWPTVGEQVFSCPEGQASNVKSGFGKAWCEVPEVKALMGDPKSAERSTTLSIDQFVNGYILQSESVAFLTFGKTWRAPTGSLPTPSAASTSATLVTPSVAPSATTAATQNATQTAQP